MDQNQYSRTQRDAYDTATADAFIRSAAKDRASARRARKNTLKGQWRGYHKAALVVCQRLFGSRGADTPSVSEIAAEILRRDGQPARKMTKEAAKQFIIEFAAGLPPVALPAEAKAPKKPRAVVTKIATPATDFYWSEEWRRVRYIALRASRGVCELCGTAPTPGSPLHVDHIKPRSKFPELELDPTNLQVLCKDCNLGKSNIDEIDWRRKQA